MSEQWDSDAMIYGAMPAMPNQMGSQEIGFLVHGGITTGMMACWNRGITRREWFAAHAPAVPDWFKTFEAPATPVRPDDSQLTRIERGVVTQLLNGSIQEPEAEDRAVAFAREFRRFQRDESTYRQRAELARLVAWRWAYADAMLEQGGRDA